MGLLLASMTAIVVIYLRREERWSGLEKKGKDPGICWVLPESNPSLPANDIPLPPPREVVPPQATAAARTMPLTI